MKCISHLLLLVGIILSAHQVAYPQVHPGDSAVLAEFNREMQKEGWPSLWDTTKQASRWRGISWDAETGRVKGIALVGNGEAYGISSRDNNVISYTADSLPPCIGLLEDLQELRELTLYFLDLRYLPAELGKLTTLTDLSLGYNHLETLPKEINDLVNIEYLFAGYNQIKTLPQLNALLKLKNLRLGINQELESFPASIFTLTNLVELELGYCSFTTLPEGIENLRNLEELDLGQGKLERLPDGIGQLSKLKVLELQYNNLTSLPGTMGSGMTALVKIDVSNNQLTSLPKAFKELPQLTSLNFTSNQLTTYPTNIVGHPTLKTINGENNLMEGAIPTEVFNKNNLELILSDNHLSGPLSISIPPQQLNITGNRFTFHHLQPHYARLKRETQGLGIHPQKPVGTYRTLEPVAGESLTLSVDQYTALPDESFTWYRIPHVEFRQSPTLVATGQQALTLPPFYPAAHTGVYYCEITHPDVPELTLKSHYIRVMGTNHAPKLTAKPLIVRSNQLPTELSGYAEDDFTYSKDLIWQLPDETEHLRLDSLDHNQPGIHKRAITLKDPTWTGTDTIRIQVSDEHGNITTQLTTITVLSDTNAAPVVEMPPVYLSLDSAYSYCNQDSCHYEWTVLSSLYPFVSDDLDGAEDLDYSIKEPSELGAFDLDSDFFAYASVGLSSGAHFLDVYMFALQDTTVTFTLVVTDNEGGRTEQPVTVVGKASNQYPEIAPIPEQLIVQGGSFPPLDLKPYGSDDHTLPEHLDWQALNHQKADVSIENGVTRFTPDNPNQPDTLAATYRLYEISNDQQYTETTVTYIVLGSGLSVSGTVLTPDQQFLAGVQLIGLPGEVVTNQQGYYSLEVPPGWSGTITPVKQGYTFSPSTIEVTDVRATLSAQDFTATYTEKAVSHTLSGTITDTQGQPLSDVAITGFPTQVLTNAQGNYSASVPAGWSGTAVPQKTDYVFVPTEISWADVQNDDTDNHFTATYQGQYTLSGQILDEQGQPVDQVTLELEGLDTKLLTNAEGKFTGQIPAGWSGTLTPRREGSYFEPNSLTISKMQAHRDGLTFTAHSDPDIVSGLEDNPIRTVRLFPNPTSGAVRLALSQPLTDPGRIVVTDLVGRTLWQATVPRGRTVLHWPGTNQAGYPVSTGSYQLQLWEAGRWRTTHRVLVVQ